MAASTLVDHLHSQGFESTTTRTDDFSTWVVDALHGNGMTILLGTADEFARVADNYGTTAAGIAEFQSFRKRPPVLTRYLRRGQVKRAGR